MHPELLENHNFKKYFSKLQRDPGSVAFVPVSEYYLKYGMFEEALSVCKQGLSAQPSLISGRLMLAKIQIKRQNLADAKNILEEILSKVPDQPAAKSLLGEILSPQNEGENQSHGFVDDSSSPWLTLTMARLHSQQGNVIEAAKIYRAILEKEPGNEQAKIELQAIEGTR